MKSLKARVEAKQLLQRISWFEDKDPGKSGNFEVTVNGKLVFSKQKTGEFPVSTKTLNDIFDAIDAALDKIKPEMSGSFDDKHALGVQVLGGNLEAMESDKLLRT